MWQQGQSSGHESCIQVDFDDTFNDNLSRCKEREVTERVTILIVLLDSAHCHSGHMAT